MTTEQRVPNVLIVDDRDEQSSLKSYLETSGLTAIVRRPGDVELGELSDASLVLVDYKIDDWPERDALDAIGLKPTDGLALAQVFRRHLQGRAKGSPTAFAIHTGKIEELSRPLPPEYREHALAQINNLEWVFSKNGLNRSLQVVELAHAVVALPEIWPSIDEGDPLEALLDLLGVDAEDVLSVALAEDVRRCLPPVHEISQWSHGLVVLRWMLHRILPYPCYGYPQVGRAA